MPATITQKKDIEATIKVDLRASELEPFKKQVVDRLRPRIKAAGFRPGKAPDNIVEREIGTNTLQSEVLEEAVSHSYSKSVQELKLRTVASPKVSITKFVPYSDLEYTATVEILPEVKLPNYKKFKVTKGKAEVTTQEVDKLLEELRYRQASKTVKKGAAEHGDEVTVDFKGTLNGKPVEKATSQNYSFRIGSSNLLPEFEKHILGKTSETEVDFDVKFPDDYHDPEVAGQTVHFDAKVNAVWQITLPEVNEEFVSQVSPFKSEKELRGDIKDKLTAQKDEEISAQYENSILNELIDQSTFPVPGSLIHEQQHRLLDEMRGRVESRGIKWEDYLKLSGKEASQLEDETKPEAERRVKLAILLSEVAQQEKLSLTKVELDDEIAKMKQTYTDSKIRAELDSPAGRESVYNHVMTQKAINRIIEYIEGRK